MVNEVNKLIFNVPFLFLFFYKAFAEMRSSHSSHKPKIASNLSFVLTIGQEQFTLMNSRSG